MTDRKVVALLLVSILVFSGLLIFVLDKVGVVAMSDVLPFFEPKNPEIMEDIGYPSEVDKMNFRKDKEKLLEKEEELAQIAADLQSRQEELERQKKELADMRANLEDKEEFLRVRLKDYADRDKKVKDLAQKVTNMQPDKATEMMTEWTDFDIIDVMRQIDKNAEEEGVQSIVPYLLTLFPPERRAEITRKMLLPPVEQE